MFDWPDTGCELLNALLASGKTLEPLGRWKIQKSSEQRTARCIIDSHPEIKSFVFQRKNTVWSDQYSIGLAIYYPALQKEIRLVRFNGDHGEHTNTDGSNVYSSHIHYASLDAIRAGKEPESNALGNQPYQSFDECFPFFLQTMNIHFNNEDNTLNNTIQLPLFDKGFES